MKLIKVLMLASVITLAACNPTSNTSSKAPEGTSASTVISSSADVREESSSATSESTSASSVESSSSTTSSSISSSTASSDTPTADKTLTINLFNPTCGSVSTEKLDARLLEYINQVAGTTFVSSVKNTNCQIINDAPTKGDKVLVIGAAEKNGYLEFKFAVTVKKVTIDAQTYYKPWVDTWSGDEPITHNNTDPNSVLRLTTTGDAPVLNYDLRPGEDEKPVEEEFTVEINSNQLQLGSSNTDHGRVFIRSLTFTY